jgi:phage I-like protein
MYECRRLNKNKIGHDLVETLVATIDQISGDILVSYGHEIGYDMHQCVSLPFLNPFNKYEFG